MTSQNLCSLSQKRCWGLLFLTLMIAVMILFLLYTSEDPRWSSNYWVHWLSSHFHLNPHLAATFVNGLRKTLHFTGYGCFGLILWGYFFLWQLKKPLIWGLLGVLLIAILDEYTQSFATFRFGKAGDVLLDFLGAVVFTGIIKIFFRVHQNIS